MYVCMCKKKKKKPKKKKPQKNNFIYYINRSIATKVDSTYLGHYSIAHSVYVLWQVVGANP